MSRHHDSDSRNFAGKLLSSGLVLFILSLVGVQVGLPFVANAISIVVSIAICGAGLVFWIGTLGGVRTSAVECSTDANSPQDVERFGISLSFPGERRSIVGQVAVELASELGRSGVFYDQFHSAILSRPNLDIYLQKLYAERTDLVVVFLCGEYNENEWCGLELRAVRTLIKQRRDDRVMLVRLDQGRVEGIFEIDGFLDAERMSPAEIAAQIRTRHKQLTRSTESEPSIDDENESGQSAVSRLRADLDRNRRFLLGSVCLKALDGILEAEPASYSLLSARSDYDFDNLRVSFSDADRKLFESDQALGGHRHSLFSMAIYIVGSGLASLLKQSSASERLLHQLARRLTEIADIPHPVDLSQIELLYAACQRRDRAEAARLLGAEFYD